MSGVRFLNDGSQERALHVRSHTRHVPAHAYQPVRRHFDRDALHPKPVGLSFRRVGFGAPPGKPTAADVWGSESALCPWLPPGPHHTSRRHPRPRGSSGDPPRWGSGERALRTPGRRSRAASTLRAGSQGVVAQIRRHSRRPDSCARHASRLWLYSHRQRTTRDAENQGAYDPRLQRPKHPDHHRRSGRVPDRASGSNRLTGPDASRRLTDPARAGRRTLDSVALARDDWDVLVYLDRPTRLGSPASTSGR